MREVIVDLGPRSYPILIGAGILSAPDIVTRWLPGPQALVVTNSTVAPLYLARVRDALTGSEVRTLVLPDGEQHKTLAVMNQIITELLRHRYSRDACIFALGGGVIGDIAGFAAACYQRGIAFIQIPTTLLAQVDSSVGGKTAVNHELGKNMIGAFHQPRVVLSDTEVLATLPRRELRAGMAEMIKYGLIRDAGFFRWLEENIDRLLALNADALPHAIERCCRIKAQIVAGDETEVGARALLNFGHTFGHAMETALDYRGWLHGEAVAAGMMIAAELSVRLGRIDAGAVARIADVLRRCELPTRVAPGISALRLREFMGVDKKSRSGRLRLVLLDAIGSAALEDNASDEDVMAAISACLPETS
ncbi:MAG: 3-dehydroquinate synthase [Gammaproteobacteria bacterium]|nr:3-dehydroquinate synthase [Gammaproteobacteria bacterium]